MVTLWDISIRLRKYVSPVDVNGVHGYIAELGHLVVAFFDILLVLEAVLAEGDSSASISHTDKVGGVALQLKPSCSFLLWTDPCFAEVNDVRLD